MAKNHHFLISLVVKYRSTCFTKVLNHSSLECSSPETIFQKVNMTYLLLYSKLSKYFWIR